MYLLKLSTSPFLLKYFSKPSSHKIREVISSFFEEEVDEVEDFDFNQDFEIEEGKRSPGWIRYQKRIK